PLAEPARPHNSLTVNDYLLVAWLLPKPAQDFRVIYPGWGWQRQTRSGIGGGESIMQMAQPAPSGKLVVVIDDDALVLEGMSGLLKGWGFEVAAAPTDSEALAELEKRGRRPDLIICDYRLAEGRSGIDAIEQLRKAFEVPAFLITAEAAPLRADAARVSQYL